MNGREFITRFISLADFGNPDKSKKGIYAFNIDPMVAMSTEELGKIPDNATANPYAELFGAIPVSLKYKSMCSSLWPLCH